MNAVRTRILDFALAIGKQAPEAGEVNTKAGEEIGPAQVTQIFQTSIYGGSAVVLGTAQNSSICLNVFAGDFNSLRSSLSDNGVSPEEIRELQDAVAGDPKPTAKGKLGPKVSSWMGKMMKKAAEGAWDVGVEVGSKVLVEAMARYYGLS